jgi:hypothetical protein
MLLAWIAVGLVGLALAAGVTYAATQLSSQRIGLSAEPPSAGEELAPRKAPARSHRAADGARSGRSGQPAAGRRGSDFKRSPGQGASHSADGRDPDD